MSVKAARLMKLSSQALSARMLADLGIPSIIASSPTMAFGPRMARMR